ncbi:MAG TPA: DUF3786 domain-containing protein [Anaerolineales bacterium]
MQFSSRVDELRSALRFQDPELVASRSGVSYLRLGPGRGELHVPLLRNVCFFSFPDLIGYDNRNEPLSDFQQAMILYYLVTADGTPLTGKWISFADLPDGRTYNTAFQGYSGDQIVKTFGLDLERFEFVCLKAGGESVDIGNASFIFQALPRVPMMLTYWLGDEDFPSSCKVLFDESASHYLPIDACAILGNMLTKKLLR